MHLCLAFLFEAVVTYTDLPHFCNQHLMQMIRWHVISISKFEKWWRFTKDIPNDDGTLEHSLNTIYLLENCPALLQEQLLASTVLLDTAQVSSQESHVVR